MLDSISYEQLENIFFLYCCTIGIIGNTLTCVLLKRRISRFKSYLARKRAALNANTQLRKLGKNNRRSATTTSSISAAGAEGAATASTSASHHNNSNSNYRQSSSSGIGHQQQQRHQHQQMLIDKCILFDYRHNWNLYLYFMGVNIFDTVILLNWIASRIPIYMGGHVSRMAYKANAVPTSSASRNFTEDEVEAMLNVSRLDPNEFERLRDAMHFSDPTASTQFDFSQPFRSLLVELGRQARYMEVKLINIQGVCQIYYYFTIVALQASLAYTLACLLDRLFKLKCINRDIVESVKKGKWAEISRSIATKESQQQQQQLIEQPQPMPPSQQQSSTTTAESSTVAATTSKALRRATTTMSRRLRLSFKLPSTTSTVITELFNPRNQQLRALTKSGHSEMVKQFFGRTSAYFIGLIILYFYFHLMWIYGATDNETPPSELDPTRPFRFLAHSDNNVGGGNNVQLDVHLYALTNMSRCELLNLPRRGHLPFFIMAFDLIILLVSACAKIVCIVLLTHFYWKHVRAQRTADAQKLQSRYLLINCVLIFSFIGLLFELPSLIMRNLQMILIILMSKYNKQIQSFGSLSTTVGFEPVINATTTLASILLANSTASSSNTAEGAALLASRMLLQQQRQQQEYEYALSRLEQLESVWRYLMNYTTQIDHFLFIVSSHKFILFLVFAHLTATGVGMCRRRRRRRRNNNRNYATNDDDDEYDDANNNNTADDNEFIIVEETTTSLNNNSQQQQTQIV